MSNILTNFNLMCSKKMSVTSSMRFCIMHGHNDMFKQKADMFSEHLRDGDMVSDLIFQDWCSHILT